MFIYFSYYLGSRAFAKDTNTPGEIRPKATSKTRRMHKGMDRISK
jgi:hypothetical protein